MGFVSRESGGEEIINTHHDRCGLNKHAEETIRLFTEVAGHEEGDFVVELIVEVLNFGRWGEWFNECGLASRELGRSHDSGRSVESRSKKWVIV